MLEIKDPNKLKITKVKPWAVYFTYDGEKYLLHETDIEYDNYITLYKRYWNGKNIYYKACQNIMYFPLTM